MKAKLLLIFFLSTCAIIKAQPPPPGGGGGPACWPPPCYWTDIVIDSIIAPSQLSCSYSSNQTIQIVIRNAGDTLIDFSDTSANAVLSISGPLNISNTIVLNSGILDSNDVDTLTYSNLNFSQPGWYNVSFFIDSIDDVTNNNGLSWDIYHIPSDTLPEYEDYTGYNGANIDLISSWTEVKYIDNYLIEGSEWDASNVLGSTSARIHRFENDNYDVFQSPTYAIDSFNIIKYKVAVANNSGGVAAMGSDDYFNVEASSNCALNWSTLQNLNWNSGIINSYEYKVIDINTLAGTSSSIRLLSSDGIINNLGQYFFHLNDVYIGPGFQLSKPSNDTSIHVQGLYSNEINFEWTKAGFYSAPVTYEWLLDLPSGDFSNPVAAFASNSSGQLKVFSLTYLTLDSILETLNVNLNVNKNLKWTVRAISAGDTTFAAIPFNITFKRGVVLKPFNLLQPVDGTKAFILGRFDQFFDFYWESQTYAGANYFISLNDSSSNEFLFRKIPGDTSMSMRYDSLDMIMDTSLGMLINDERKVYWNVYIKGFGDTLYAENGPFELDLVRRELSQDYYLNNPLNDTIIDLTSNQKTDYRFDWTEAQFNGNGDIKYSFYLTDSTGDFSKSIFSLLSDNSGEEEFLYILRDNLQAQLDAHGFHDSEMVECYWTVITNIGDTAIYPFKVNLVKNKSWLAVPYISNEKGLSIVPNPMTNQAIVSFANPDKVIYSFKLIDIKGNMVETRSIQSDGFTINRSALKPGLYFVALYSWNTSFRQPLIISND